MKGWINGVTLFMRYFSYICVWFAFVMALMSFDIPTHGFGWVMYVIGVVCISSYMTIRVIRTAERMFDGNLKRKQLSRRQFKKRGLH